MKCNKPFILAYNDLFKFLDTFGYDYVQEFWKLLEHALFGRLRYLTETEGLTGMLKYWSEVLTAEGAKYKIALDMQEGIGLLTINIFRCPSLSKIEEEGEQCYQCYCNHCVEIYPRLLKPLGFDFTLIATGTGCLIRIVPCKTDS